MKKAIIVAAIIAVVFLVVKSTKKKPCGCLNKNSAIDGLTEEELKEQLKKMDVSTDNKSMDELKTILKSKVNEN